ncbi:MAG: OmpA family protein [Gemmatimonadales bacterium]
MSSRSLLVAGLAALLATGPAAAQAGSSVELGGFGRYTWFDTKLGIDDGAGFGGRIGFFFLRNLAIEGDASYVTVPSGGLGNVSYVPIHAGLTYNLPWGQDLAILVGGRWAHNEYGGVANASDNGVGGLLGIRLGRGFASARLEATGDYMSNSDVAGGRSYWNWGANAGISLIFGPRGPRDRDKDGVSDELDACPNTPAGERVDARGCPLPKDSDGDGVTDNIDACPGTPAGERVDARGCPLPRDADGDGVIDANDACPNTPAGTRVDARGCPLDSDRDGVSDAADACPGTPAGDQVDARGCSLPKDSDGDGVMDPDDRCPNTPRGTQVDGRGCPVLFAENTTTLVLEGVNFEFNKAVLTAEAKTVLDRVAESLNGNPEVRVEVAGYTDSRGSRAYNLRLSQERAEAVRAYLIEQGVAAERLTARGYGPDDPVAPNTTDEGRGQNRRVELHRLG